MFDKLINKIIASSENVETISLKTLDEFINDYSLKIDKIIIETEDNEHSQYLYGTLRLDVTTKNNELECSFKLYFKDKSGSVFLKDSTSGKLPIDLCFYPEVIAKGLKPVYEYEILSPKDLDK